ncbi:T-cell surface glycoprotein CD8 alpha chain isoform X2 [Cyprinodon tularosa]|uniref:T-cell surface glycoprotein CD8 alpha chain isoform X2 n=1 Tax=Cyprinodon tularosa TaxID=77115 RepID=UPI0018E2415A|nr:T-cell surface glycoprotein CD8 alpha chain isoform X2 [Cyprinodon tularosa]
MDQKMMQILLILLLYPKIPSAVEVGEGQSQEIKCSPPNEGSITIKFLFRVLDKSGMEFIGSFSKTGVAKETGASYNSLSVKYSEPSFIITVKKFNKEKDSGIYSCASLVGGNNLQFGDVTTLKGKFCLIIALKTTSEFCCGGYQCLYIVPLYKGKHKATMKPPEIQAPATTQASTTRRSCDCTIRVNSDPSLFCAPIILGPLAGACGLLLLLLIVTFLYCNRIRTRRCPHHYKRKLRTMAPEKETITNRYI